MGAVYRAFDPFSSTPSPSRSRSRRRRWTRRRNRGAKGSSGGRPPQHPGIVTVFDLGNHTTAALIVTVLLKGQDLLARLRDAPPLSLGQKVSIVTQVLDGLGHAHKRGSSP